MGKRMHASREHFVGDMDTGGCQALGVQFAVLAQGVVFGGDNQGVRHSGQVGGEQGGNKGVAGVGRGIEVAGVKKLLRLRCQ